ncbi:phosphoglycerate kinase [Alphaproteobacteria bacterium]|nr:phosphoglycerate kinase [Alphaproteobacteria bacterium]
MKFKTLSDCTVKNKRVLVRVDFNVPMKDGVITDKSRIQSSLLTLKELRESGAKIILISHLGRPKGKKDPIFSLRPMAEVLKKMLPGASLYFSEDTIGSGVEKKSKELSSGDILLLENLRFYPQEEKNDLSFAKKLSLLGDIYVNDAFSASHRSHASIDRITNFLPSYAGRLLEAELKSLKNFLGSPKKPMIGILGGAKISSKLDLIMNLLDKVSALLIGGGMANTFLQASGVSIGSSLNEPSLKKKALSIMKKAETAKCKFILPTDVVVAQDIKGKKKRIAFIDDIKKTEMVLDVGPETLKNFEEIIKKSKTVIWNGPLGLVEVPPFDQGTQKMAIFLAKQKNIITVSGGGDTAALLNRLDVLEDFSYVSMAGGAFLEWLEGRSLPGLKALEKKEN